MNDAIRGFRDVWLRVSDWLLGDVMARRAELKAEIEGHRIRAEIAREQLADLRACIAEFDLEAANDGH